MIEITEILQKLEDHIVAIGIWFIVQFTVFSIFVGLGLEGIRQELKKLNSDR